MKSDGFTAKCPMPHKRHLPCSILTSFFSLLLSFDFILEKTYARKSAPRYLLKCAMSRNDRLYLCDILRAIERIERHTDNICFVCQAIVPAEGDLHRPAPTNCKPPQIIYPDPSSSTNSVYAPLDCSSQPRTTI